MTIYIVEVGPGYEAADEVVAFSKRADAEAYVAHIEAEPDYRGRLGTNWTRITEVVVDSARVSRDAANRLGEGERVRSGQADQARDVVADSLTAALVVWDEAERFADDLLRELAARGYEVRKIVDNFRKIGPETP